MNAFIIAVVTVAAACGGDDKPVTKAPVRPDSASGEVAQYALMKNSIGWLTDSNVVALATQVNADAQGIARLEAQAWTKEPFRYFASEMLAEHNRLQSGIDSIASLRRVPSQMPAVGPELKVPYDSLVNSQAGLPLADREAQFLDMVIRSHERSVLDFGALAGNATDPDLKAFLANRAVLLEETHIARARMIAGALAHADSVKQDSLKATKKGGGR